MELKWEKESECYDVYCHLFSRSICPSISQSMIETGLIYCRCKSVLERNSINFYLWKNTTKTLFEKRYLKLSSWSGVDVASAIYINHRLWACLFKVFKNQAMILKTSTNNAGHLRLLWLSAMMWRIIWVLQYVALCDLTSNWFHWVLITL